MGVNPDNLEMLRAANSAAWDRVRELLSRFPAIRNPQQEAEVRRAQSIADRTKYQLEMSQSRRRA